MKLWRGGHCDWTTPLNVSYLGRDPYWPLRLQWRRSGRFSSRATGLRAFQALDEPWSLVQNWVMKSQLSAGTQLVVWPGSLAVG
jgi:hypothetical protein